MELVDSIKQTPTVPELRSRIAAFASARSVYDKKLVCEATAWPRDLGPAYVNHPGERRRVIRSHWVFRRSRRRIGFPSF